MLSGKKLPFSPITCKACKCSDRNEIDLCQCKTRGLTMIFLFPFKNIHRMNSEAAGRLPLVIKFTCGLEFNALEFDAGDCQSSRS